MIDSERYFITCQRYVELNPVRAALARSAAGYAWSSHRHYAFGVKNSLVTPHEVFTSLALDEAGRREAYLALCAQPLAAEELEKIREATNKGWPLGSETFVRNLESALGRAARPSKPGPRRAEMLI